MTGHGDVGVDERPGQLTPQYLPSSRAAQERICRQHKQKAIVSGGTGSRHKVTSTTSPSGDVSAPAKSSTLRHTLPKGMARMIELLKFSLIHF